MKTNQLLSIALSFLALVPARAAEPGVTDTIKIIQTSPATGTVQAFWEKSTVVDGQTFAQPLVENSWKLTDTGTVSITLADGTVAVTNRAAVFAAVVTIATQEHNKMASAPAP